MRPSDPNRRPIQPVTRRRPETDSAPASGSRPAPTDPPSHAPSTQPRTPARSDGLSIPRQSSTSTRVPLTLEKYRVGAEVGRGGLGIVRAAEDTDLRREVAIKVLLNPHNADNVAEFIEEAQITGQLEHPNIVPVHELGRDGQNRPFLAMKLVRGRTLLEIITAAKATGRRSTLADLQHDRRLDIVAKVCDAMAYAHSRGVIHRDLKPENVMVGEFGEVLVMDWGLAKVQRREPASEAASETAGDTPAQLPTPATSSQAVRVGSSETEAVRTMMGDVLGTPAYMPPEQASGRIDVLDHRTDVFAIGGILYEALTLARPYDGADLEAVLAAAAERKLAPPRKRAPQQKIPPELDAIAMKAMAKRPADRYATVADLRRDLDAFLANERVRAHRESLLGRIGKWAKRHPTKAMMLTMSVLFAGLATAGAGLFVAQIAKTEQANERLAREKAEAAQRAVAAHAEREQAEWKTLAAEGKVNALMERLGVRLEYQRNQALDEFYTRWNEATRAGKSSDEFFADMPATEIRATVAVFEDAIKAGEQFGKQFHTATDLYLLSMLHGVGLADWPQSIEYARQSTALDPTNGRAWFMHGLAARNVGRDDEAFDAYKHAIARDPKLAEPLVNLAGIHRDRAEYAEALDLLAQALVVNPRRYQAHGAMGDVYRAMGDLAKADECYTRALEIFPRYYSAVRNRARTRAALGNVEGALADYEVTLKNIPQALYYVERGVILKQLGRNADAETDFSAAIDLEPAVAIAWFGRGNARLDLGKPALALADYDHALALDATDAKFHANRGAALVALNRHAEADAAYDRALDLDPKMANVWGMRGDLQTRLAQWELADKYYSRALDLDETYFEARFGRARARQASGDFSGARDDLDRLIAAKPRADLYMHRGVASLMLNQAELAAADFSAAIDLEPHDARHYYNRGNALTRLGNSAAAIADYSRAIDRAPSFGEAFVNRGNQQLALGNIDLALADFREAIRVKPNLWNAWGALGFALAQIPGREHEAIEPLQQLCRLTPDPRVRQRAIEILCQLGAEVPE